MMMGQQDGNWRNWSRQRPIDERAWNLLPNYNSTLSMDPRFRPPLDGVKVKMANQKRKKKRRKQNKNKVKFTRHKWGIQGQSTLECPSHAQVKAAPPSRRHLPAMPNQRHHHPEAARCPLCRAVLPTFYSPPHLSAGLKVLWASNSLWHVSTVSRTYTYQTPLADRLWTTGRHNGMLHYTWIGPTRAGFFFLTMFVL